MKKEVSIHKPSHKQVHKDDVLFFLSERVGRGSVGMVSVANFWHDGFTGCHPPEGRSHEKETWCGGGLLRICIDLYVSRHYSKFIYQCTTPSNFLFQISQLFLSLG